MTVEQIITLLDNKIVFIQAQLTSAIQRGDLVSAEQFNGELVTTQTTLDQLKTLL
jgi:hypothetical protein